MLSKRNVQPLPESGVIVRRSGKIQYVYKVLSTFRNDKGQPTNTRKLIGRLSADGAGLLPNDSYYEFYGKSEEVLLPAELASNESYVGVVSIGASYLVRHILMRLGVVTILERIFGTGRLVQIITSVSYMICEGNVFEHISDWCYSFSVEALVMSSQKASKLFASIQYSERLSFFKEWIAVSNVQGLIAYDVTSFSSYAEGIADLEWGYNRDGDRLPQINLGCYVSQETRLPLFYVTYPGSIVDKSHFPYMMAYNDELGIGDRIIFVMDRGFCSTSNINYMHSKGIKYICGVDMLAKTTFAAIDEVRTQIMSLRYMVGKGVYGMAVCSRFYGEASVMHIFYNHELVEPQRRDLMRTVENMEQQLSQLEVLSKKDHKRFSRYFEIAEEEGSIKYERNYDKIDEAAKNSGFFCIISNTGYVSRDILEIYKRKDVIEKGFDDIKNHLEMKRLRVHSEATVDGKLFCAFIALIAASEMANCLNIFNDASDRRSLSKRALIAELNKIKIFDIAGKRRLINPLTKTQRNILEVFGITQDDIV